MAAALIITLGVAFSAQAKDKSCSKMKDKKGREACCAGVDLKTCSFTDKKENKGDRPVWVCPDRCFCGKNAGKCPECGKTLEKKFCPKMKDAKCPMMKGDKAGGACCMGKDGKQNCVCPKCQCKDGKPCDCKKCCKAWKDGKCPMKKGKDKGKKVLDGEATDDKI
jgi:hypothetical protein